MRRILDAALAGLLAPAALGLAVAPAQAQHASRDAMAAAHVASGAADRFPAPRGASLARAQRLSLGSADAGRALLHRPPSEALVRAASRGHTDVPSLHWPVDDGRFGRGFGFVRTTLRDRRHDGVDMVAPRGAVIRSVADGIVAYSGDGIRGFGNALVIVHPNGWVTVYAHTDRITVPTGYRVRRGERVAFVGSTGISQGPHLHFELIVDGRAVDPMPHFDGKPWVEARARWQAGELSATREHLGEIAPDYSSEARDAAPAASARPNEAPTGPSEAPARPSAASSALTPSGTPATPSDAPQARVGLSEARRLLRHPPRAESLERLGLPTYSTLLWPLRGGALGDSSARALVIEGDAQSPVRAAADGLVIYAGDALPGSGRAIVLLHANGWVTVYTGLDELAVREGETTLRGAWMGKLAPGSELRFELRDEGRLRDARPLLVQVPSAPSEGRSSPGVP